MLPVSSHAVAYIPHIPQLTMHNEAVFKALRLAFSNAYPGTERMPARKDKLGIAG
jgi:hypothetical protein